MPQDHASWDRKDLLKQRKHERSEQSFDSNFRWSNSSTVSSSHHVRRDFSRRGSGELGRHPGHGKQSGWHQFVKETDHGHASSQSRARIFEDDNYRPNSSRGDRRYNRNPRDGRVSFIQKDWKYHTWEVNNGSSRVFGRLPDRKLDCLPVDERPSSASDLHTAMLKLSVPANSTQQNVEVWTPVRTLTGKTEKNFANQSQSTPSHPHSGSVSLYEQPYLEDKHDDKVCSPGRQCHDVSSEQRFAEKSSLHPSNSLVDLEVTWGQLHSKDQLDNKEHGSDEIDIAKQSGKESSLVEIDWKYPIWTRSGSFAYRGSGFNLSSSPKGFGAVDFHEQKTEFVPKVVAVTESTSGDDAASFTSSCLPEEMNSRKKPRLGWGEGLAKYEKKKVDANVSEDGTLLTNSTREVYSLPDKSPTMVGATDFGSPATPSSVACSSSPGMGDKASAIAAKAVSDSSNLLSSPSPVSNYQLERFTLNLDDMGTISMENLSCSINALLRTDDSGTGDSCSVLSNAINKVLAWKVDILKALEVTESEIDLLENKRRALQFEAGSFCPHQNGSSSYFGVSNKNVPSKLGAHCVAERPEEAVHKVLWAKVPDDACGDVVERSQDTVDICSIKMATSSTNVDMTGFAIGSTMINNDAVDISYGGCCMASEEDVVYTFLASNRKSASETSEVFKMLLPRPFSCLDVSRFSAICQEKVDPHIKQKIAVRKRHMRVKNKILVLKFKAFQLSWKRDMHRLFIAKYNAKSQKNRESNMCIRHGALQKLPQSVRLKFSSPAPGIHSPSPATELLNFMEKLLPDIQHKPCRDILRMPAMILDEKEKVISRFISSNGLVEDPCAVEKERTMINPWTSKEKEIFLNRLATYGKDFRKIASHLEQKTTADCIDFYYKNHKSFCLEKIKKKHYSGKEGKCTYMLAPQKKLKREMGAASLDILGAVSMIAANASKVASTRQMPSKRIAFRSCSGSRSLQPSKNSSEGCVYNFDLTHKQTVSADGLTGGDCSLSPGPISSCFRSYVAPNERCLEYSKLDPTLKMCRLSDAIHKDNSNDEDDSCSEESCEQTGPVHWTDEERSAFVQGFLLYGKNFAMISRCVGTRSQDQCRVYFSKIKKCLESELILPRSGNVSTSASVDNCIEGDGSEVENPCALEASSVMCNGGLCAKMDACSPKSPLNINRDGVEHSGSLKTDLDRSEQENGSACLHLKDDTELADTSVSLKRDCPDLVSAFGRDFLDVKTVENQSHAVQKSKSDQLLSAATNEGLSASTIVSPWPSSSNASILANLVESFAERSRKYYIPTQTENRTRDPSIQAEAASSSGVSFPECLHHVPIKVCMEDPISLHLLQENPSSHSETVYPSSFAVQDVKRGNLETRSSSAHLSFGEKNRFHGHVKYDQNSLQDVHIGNKDVLEIPRSSFMPDPSKQKRSKSDVIANTTQRTGEGFSLSRCSSLTSSFSTTKKLRLSHKEGRSGHGHRHSSSLSDTERPYRNRVVKLFGTILASHDHEKMQHPQESVRPSSTATDLHELQNVPITSYGFWDGNRIWTGFTSLQHLEAFTNHVESSVSEVQAGSSREIQVDGLSVYTRRKLNGSSEIPRFVTESQMDHGRDNLGFMSFGNDEHKKRGHR